MKIFISYRNSDAVAATARLLQERLAEYFGPGSVFLDSSSLATAERFTAVLEEKVRECSVFIALIDPAWVAAAERLHEPTDWVRREIEMALHRLGEGETIRVVPVLLFGATMPEGARLPVSVAPLVELQAAPPLRGKFIEQDLAALVKHVDGWSVDRWMLWMQARRRAALGVTLGVLLIFSASVLALFDTLTIDTRLEALTLGLADAMADAPPSDRLALVVIDPATQARLGRPFGPSWRHDHAQLIRGLAEAGAAVVAFDVFLREKSEWDAELQQAVAAARERGTRVVFGVAGGVAPGAAPLADSGIEFGLLCIGNELDWARSSPLAVQRNAGAGAGAMPATRQLPALGTLAARPGSQLLMVDLPNRQIVLQGPDRVPQALPFSRSEPVTSAQPCAALARGDMVAQRIIRFSDLERLREPGRRLRYEDVLAAPAGTAAWQGKIVLVGTELNDEDSRRIFRGLGTELRYGHEIQADVVNTLLGDINIRPVAGLPQFLVTLAMGALGLAARFWPRLWPRGRALVWAVAACLGFVAFNAWLCAEFQLLLNTAYPLAAFLFAHWVSGAVLRSKGLWNPQRQ